MTEDAVGPWRTGVPTVLFVLGPPLTLVVFVAGQLISGAGEPSTIAELVSWRYAVTGLIAGAAVVGCCLGAVRPRMAALSAGIGPIGTVGTAVGHLEVAMALGWGSVLVVDMVLRRHQAQVAPVAVETSTRTFRGGVVLLGPVRLVVAVVSVAAIVFGAAVWTDRRDDFIALDSRAVAGQGTVAEYDEGVARIEVDGRTFTFWDPQFADLPIGTVVDVMVDPTGVERPFGPGDADPDGWSDVLLLVGAGGMGLAGAVVSRWRRVRAVRRILHDPPSGVRARLALDEAAGRLAIVPLDADRPVALVTGLEAVRRDRAIVGFVTAIDPLEVLLAQRPDDGDQFGYRHTVDAVVYGLRRFGDPVLIEVVRDGQPLVVAVMGQVVDPRTVRSAIDRLPSIRRRGHPEPEPGPAPDHGEPGAIPLAMRRHAAVLRWSVVPLAACVAWAGAWLWTPDDEDLGSWALLAISVWALASGGAWLWSWGTPEVRVRGQRLRLKGGTVFDPARRTAGTSWSRCAPRSTPLERWPERSLTVRRCDVSSAPDCWSGRCWSFPTCRRCWS